MLMTLWLMQEADMGVPAGWLNAIGAPGLVVLLFYLLATGRLATGRELREKDRRIAYLEEALTQRDKQLSLLMGEAVPVTSAVLNALHAAAAEGGTP